MSRLSIRKWDDAITIDPCQSSYGARDSQTPGEELCVAALFDHRRCSKRYSAVTPTNLGRRQYVESDLVVLIELKNVVHHFFHRVTSLFQKFDSSVKLQKAMP